MNSAHFVGRVGGLAVALGVGAAVFTGTGVAWADSPSDESSSRSSASDKPARGTKVAKSDPGAGRADSAPRRGSATSGRADAEETAEETAEPDASRERRGRQRSGDATDVGDDVGGDDVAADTGPAEPDARHDNDAPAGLMQVEAAAEPARAPTRKLATADVPETATDQRVVVDTAPAVMNLPGIQQSSVQRGLSRGVDTAAPTPRVPSWRPWSTAFDLRTAVTYVSGLVTSLVDAVLYPFTAGPPQGPADLSAWGLVAWVRREFFNQTPTVVSNPSPYTQSLNTEGDVIVTGNVGVHDPDGDALTYTVIGRPRNGGTVQVDQNGNFVYRPMNAMAALGGTDTFTVAVSDMHAGLHVHGLAGALQFVPILGNLLNPGGGHGLARAITVTVAPVAGVDLSLPDGFHWGVAHSGFQAEGGPGSPVDPRSDWYRWVHDPINQLLGLVKGVPENGPGAYVSYEGDADLARDQLGMNTFRMSVEWSRIFPNSTAAVDISDEGGGVSLADLQALDALADAEEVAHYRAVFEALRIRGLEPMVTVNHFTLPVWVHDPITARPLIQLGLPAPAAGWLSSSTPEEFEKYAAYLAWKYGDQVDNWVTINEPFPPVLTELLAIPGLVPSWPPGVIRPDLASTFLVNQAIGHVAAYDAIHAWDTTAATVDGPAAFVGFAHNMIPARPADPINPLDVQAADAWNHFYNGWFPNAVIDGWVDVNFDGIKTADEIFPDMTGKVDFLGVQYYGSQPMIGFGLAPLPGFPFLRGIPVRCEASSPTCSDFNQPTDPGGFREVLEFAASYGKPLWITENGIAEANDSKRPSYIVNHIAVVQDLVAHGTDIRGYTYWSFVDNLEWADGYHLQFGLYGSDPHTPELERTPKPASIAAISGITMSNGLPLHLLAQYLPKAV